MKETNLKSPEPIIEEPESPLSSQRAISASIEEAEYIEVDDSSYKRNKVEERELAKIKGKKGMSVQIEEMEVLDSINEATPVDEKEFTRQKSKTAVSATVEEAEVVDKVTKDEPQKVIETDTELSKVKPKKGRTAQVAEANVLEVSDTSPQQFKEKIIDNQEHQKGKRDYDDELDEKTEELLRRAQKQRSLVEDVNERPSQAEGRHTDNTLHVVLHDTILSLYYIRHFFYTMNV